MKGNQRSILMTSLVMISAIAGAQAVQQPRAPALEVGRPLARISLLTPSVRIYLRYKIIGERRETVDMWRREVSFENHQGRRLLHISD